MTIARKATLLGSACSSPCARLRSGCGAGCQRPLDRAVLMQGRGARERRGSRCRGCVSARFSARQVRQREVQPRRPAQAEQCLHRALPRQSGRARIGRDGQGQELARFRGSVPRKRADGAPSPPQRRRELERLIRQHRRLLLDARGRLHRLAVAARDDVHMQVEHHLSAGALVELLDRDRRRRRTPSCRPWRSSARPASHGRDRPDRRRADCAPAISAAPACGRARAA